MPPLLASSDELCRLLLLVDKVFRFLLEWLGGRVEGFCELILLLLLLLLLLSDFSIVAGGKLVDFVVAIFFSFLFGASIISRSASSGRLVAADLPGSACKSDDFCSYQKW